MVCDEGSEFESQGRKRASTRKRILTLMSRRWQGFRRKKLRPARGKLRSHQLLDIVSRLAFKTLLGNLARVRVLDSGDRAAHARDRRDVHAQLRRAETDEHDRIGWRRGHLSADDRRNKSGARRVERAFDALQDRRMQRAKPI